MSFHYFSEQPCDALRPFVQEIWGVRGTAHYHVEAVVPSGVMELMISFGPRQELVEVGDRTVERSFDGAWLAGMQQRRLVHAAPAGSDHIAVRFRPGGAHAFFGLPMEALTDDVVDLEALIGREARVLRDRLGELTSDDKRVRTLERWLLGRRESVHPYYATIRRALDHLHGPPPRPRIAELCERLGLSNRHLVRQFDRVIGVSPKSMARILRFQSVIADTRGHADVPWSTMATRHGYADQSHLIREFREFTTVSPTEFLRRRTPDESNVVVA